MNPLRRRSADTGIDNANIGVAELNVHLRYIQGTLEDITVTISNMATKDDIKELTSRMNTFVTTEEFNRLKDKVDSNTLAAVIKRFIAGLVIFVSGVAASSEIYKYLSNFFKH